MRLLFADLLGFIPETHPFSLMANKADSPPSPVHHIAPSSLIPIPVARLPVSSSSSSMLSLVVLQADGHFHSINLLGSNSATAAPRPSVHQARHSPIDPCTHSATSLSLHSSVHHSIYPSQALVASDMADGVGG